MWSLTFLEYDALKQVADQSKQRWAVMAAMFRNAHRKEGEPAFLPVDFVDGMRGYEERRRQSIRDRLEVSREQRRMAQVRRVEDVQDVPDWARNAGSLQTWQPPLEGVN